MEALGGGVEVSGDYICGEDVCAVRVWVAEEVGQAHGGERVVVVMG